METKCNCGNALEPGEQWFCDDCIIFEDYRARYEALPKEQQHDWRGSYLSGSTYCARCHINLTYGTGGPEDYLQRCAASYPFGDETLAG